MVTPVASVVKAERDEERARASDAERCATLPISYFTAYLRQQRPKSTSRIGARRKLQARSLIRIRMYICMYRRAAPRRAELVELRAALSVA